jgi:hypothetical protein
VTAGPFVLSAPVTISVPPPGGPARLGLWFVDDAGVPRARTFVDAAAIEPPNRRGARSAAG